MALKDIFKITRKTFFNPTAWADLDSIKFQNNTLFSILKGMLTPAKAEAKETFEQAMQRMGLNEQDIKQAHQNYVSYALFFLLCGVGLVVFAFYLVIVHHTLSGLLLGLATAAISFAQAFRYDFWALQIKYRKLGFTFAEWKQRKPFN